MERAATASALGLQFSGNRDVYDAAGYPDEITFADYYNRYKRQDVARRVIDAPVGDSWLFAPSILDGATPSEASSDTEFVAAWNVLADGNDENIADTDGVFRRGLLHQMARADRTSGIGKFSLLIFGFRDGKDLAEPVAKRSLAGPGGLVYASVAAETNVVIGELDTDETSNRFGLPVSYDVTFQDDRVRTVHWTRVIHVADPIDNELEGDPRLQVIFNRLIDLDKVVPAAGEAAWRLLQPVLLMKTQSGTRLPTGDGDRQRIEDQATEMVHGLRRTMLAQGLDPEILEGSLQDPSAIVDVLIKLISIATGIPKRILEGSERGELSSSQDERTWGRWIASRQRNFVEPVILRPVIHRLVYAGVLPVPKTGRYCVTWKPLVEPTENEAADTATKVAEALEAVGAVVSPEDFAKLFFPRLGAVVGHTSTDDAPQSNAARWGL